jgi:hypothetical protein
MQQSTGTKPQKSYEGPALEKLTPEQAKEFLLHHANMGDQGAKDILKLVLPASDDLK